MWPRLYSDRLEEWACLRATVSTLDTEQCLFEINRWWFRAPWTSYYLHWDDRDNWADPWQLLEDNIFCSLARGLGIMYTITMLERLDIQDAILAECDQDNLVLIGSGKYILNWEADQIVNIHTGAVNPRRQILQQSLKIR